MRTMLSCLLVCLAACQTEASDPVEAVAEADQAPASATLVVLNKSEASVSWIDAATGETLGTSPTGAGPHEVALSPDGSTAVVCDYGERQPGSTLTVLDTRTGEVLDTIHLDGHLRPHGIQFEDDWNLIVTSERSRALLRVDLTQGRVVAEFPTEAEASHMVVLNPARSTAFVANIQTGSVTAIDLASGEILRQIPTGRGAEGLDITPDGRELWVANRAEDTLTILDARTFEVEASLPCTGFPIRIKITPDGAHALVSSAESGDVAVFDVPGRRQLRRIPMELTAADDVSDRLFGDQFGESPVPIGILITPDGRRAYIANTNVDLVTVLDLESWSVTDRITTGKQPDGLGFTTVRPEFSAAE
jgi:YVTN family beta-propeller protein